MTKPGQIAFDLKTQRVQYDLSQEELAEILFVHQSQISRWESNGKMPMAYQQLWKTWKEKQNDSSSN